ncbi:MAG: histidine phosphatase family protein [Streptosporangiales bacterium]|nr:histidine phosphatase family protein [Streptosporangiales bacterium]
MSGARRVVLWRHGQTQWNLEKRFQGGTDIPLTETGMAEAKAAAARLATLQPAVIVASDLVRATATADALVEATGRSCAYDPRLRERFGGSWEGLTQAEIRDAYPAAWEQWQPADGEHEAEVGERVAAAIGDVVADLPAGELAVVVSHGGAIRAGIGRVLGLQQPLWRCFGPLSNCAWSVLGESAAGWRLLEHNAGTLPEPALSDDR